MSTGDKIELHINTVGHGSRVVVNGDDLPYVRGLELKVQVGEITTLKIETIYPPLAGDVVKTPTVKYFAGYFVSPEDYAAFEAWQKARCEK